MTADPVPLAAALIACPSVTPDDAGAQELLARALKAQRFTVTRLRFGATENLFARRGRGGPHLCFAGHTDVVPAGDGWTTPAFTPTERDGALYGRGATDMKGAIASFVAACGAETPGTVSLLITGDEEGPATDGTVRVAGWLRETGQIPDFAVVGEPTCRERVGDTVKTGRRGSLTAHLTVRGIQGHAAYPHLADNPLHRLARIVAALTAAPLDDGTEHFGPSTLQFTTIDTANPASNVIPAKVHATLNVRYNDAQTADGLRTKLADAVAVHAPDHELRFVHGAECFRTPPSSGLAVLRSAIEEVTGIVPEGSTAGGTSDARFLARLCPVAEFGLVGRTMHQADEHATVADLRLLAATYRRMIETFA